VQLRAARAAERAAVEQCRAAGNAAFARGHLEAAIEAYSSALESVPCSLVCRLRSVFVG
jgi:hypothetical protein